MVSGQKASMSLGDKLSHFAAKAAFAGADLAMRVPGLRNVVMDKLLQRLGASYDDNEDDPDQTVMVMRRRAGAEDWDMPEPWPDFADAACAAPVFWNDRGHLWLFFGFPRLIGAPPFAFTTSDDNGATWAPIAAARRAGCWCSVSE